jgi:hypothetical protein
MTNCPHCRNTGYDVSGYPCTCGLDPKKETGYSSHDITFVLFFAMMVLAVAMLIAGIWWRINYGPPVSIFKNCVTLPSSST